MKKYFFVIFAVLFLNGTASSQNKVASIEPAKSTQCPTEIADCGDYDAIVFVHGIYGGTDTFKNSQTEFFWPKEIPSIIANRRIDVFVATYQTEMINWATSKDPTFDAVTNKFFEAMAPLRERKYRSIGFIAHSLGGNVVATYVHRMKSAHGHIARARHAYIVTLGTPISGAHVANVASILKSILNMDDELLASLKKENLFLEMLGRFRTDDNTKALSFLCRPVHLYAAYETKTVAGVKIVQPEDATGKFNQLFSEIPSPLIANHSTIAKPSDTKDPVYLWVDKILDREMLRLNEWEKYQAHLPLDKQICNPPPGVL